MLKVGELARRTGLTVRTLHHYDQIGLLRPSGRSDGGYRLYAPDDVARLHGIQALRSIGLPLDEIASVLDADGADLRAMVERQLIALDHEIARSTQLRERLRLIQSQYDAGDPPSADDWLDTLQAMTASGPYFSAAEMRIIFGNARRYEPQWQRLMADVRQLMDQGVPPLHPTVHHVARRWSNLMLLWMNGDLDLVLRYGRLYLADPALRGRHGPDLAMARYVEPAAHQRLARLLATLGEADLRRLAPVPDDDWTALAGEVTALIEQGVAPGDAAAAPAVRQWRQLGHRAARGDAALWQRVMAAFDADPLLRQTSPLAPDVRDFLQRADAARARAHHGA